MPPGLFLHKPGDRHTKPQTSVDCPMNTQTVTESSTVNSAADNIIKLQDDLLYRNYWQMSQLHNSLLIISHGRKSKHFDATIEFLVQYSSNTGSSFHCKS